jgi:hypothetical protein
MRGQFVNEIPELPGFRYGKVLVFVALVIDLKCKSRHNGILSYKK